MTAENSFGDSGALYERITTRQQLVSELWVDELNGQSVLEDPCFKMPGGIGWLMRSMQATADAICPGLPPS